LNLEQKKNITELANIDKFDNKMYIVCNVYCPSILFQHLQNILFCSITINKYIFLRSCNIIVHYKAPVL
jgi:hypothetical protein